MRFVGLGDSLTEGVGDPQPGFAGFTGKLDGWVHHLAAAISQTGSEVTVDNYASAGARLEHVIADQLPRLHATCTDDCPPDMISCFIGVNDLWDANLDFDEFARSFDDLFAQLVTMAPTVITASIHDVFAPYPIKASLRQKLAGNIALMNEIIGQAVVTHNLVLADFANRSEMFTSSVLAVDRLHPSRYGHLLIAGEVLTELQTRGLFLDATPPAATPARRGLADIAHVAWIGQYAKRNLPRWRAEVAANKARDAAKPESTSDSETATGQTPAS